MRLPCNRRFFSFLFAFAFCLAATHTAKAQPGSSNVLYSDYPLPVRIGIEVGATYSPFLNSTPTYFPTQYPYKPIPDTIHMSFPTGAKAGVGLHLGIAADFAISKYWGIMTKLNYNERRASWHATVPATADTGSGPITVPLTNDLNLVLRYVSLELMARYSFKSLDWFYLAGGVAVSDMTSNNYSVTQSLGNPQNVSFNSTGVRQYSLSNSFNNSFNTILGEVKLLAGFPIRIGHRWTLNPEVTAAYPFTQLFNAASRTAYQQAGISNPPNVLTFVGILALRYEL